MEVDPQRLPDSMEVSFNALGRDFFLELTLNRFLFHPDAVVEVYEGGIHMRC